MIGRPPTRAEVAAALLVLLAGGDGPAASQERPPEAPTRDVAVAYRLLGDFPPERAEMRMSWLVAENRVRMDFPGGAWTVVDRNDARGSFMAVDGERVVMPMPAGAEALPGVPSAARAAGRFTRAGTAGYAGQPCIVWRYEDGKQTGEACVTNDGVLLRGVGAQEGRTGGMEATRVVYGPQDPGRFRRPEGYRTIQAPPASPPSR